MRAHQCSPRSDVDRPPRPEFGAATGFDPSRERWTAYEPVDGERLHGRVERLPASGSFNGTRLFVRRSDGSVVGLHATASRGHTVLARRLEELPARVGDVLTITYLGRRRTADGEREYRAYEVARG